MSKKVSKSGPSILKPVIISASRSTDIPAFYSDKLMERIRVGYCTWVNPFNQQLSYVSFDNTHAFVFWTKNPAPMLRHIDELDCSRFAYYFHFTVNDYENEGLEPGIPPLEERLDTFIRLSERVGKHKVIWRFDPVIISLTTPVDNLLERVKKIGDRLHMHTEKLVFSFVDIAAYKKVQYALKRNDFRGFEPTDSDIHRFASGLIAINKDWNLTLATCCESVSLEGIEHNKCIDGQLLSKIAMEKLDSMLYLYCSSCPKDDGQRNACGCVTSKDIGMYNTCRHNCVYCYANTSVTAVESRIAKLSNDEETVCRL